MDLIAKQNTKAVEAGRDRYVTVAFMGPLTSKDPRVVSELEGAYTAQSEANATGNFPKIRVALANQGRDESHWQDAVAPLVKMDANPDDHLLAVVGLGLSQDESLDAARALNRAAIPMVGDIITADGFNATGTIDGKGPIPGLVRVAQDNTSQLKAISAWLRPSHS